ncbi:MAG: TIGR02584 family CRISPR-associated protein [Azospirillum sp.]|nr:TIGR02584 family CRISPR-associated protein [Azospirillum sp.]
MRTVLLSTAGMTPAVITETLWSLRRRDGTMPAGLVVVTTTEGKARLVGTGRFAQTAQFPKFLGRGGALEAFLRDYASGVTAVPVHDEKAPLDAFLFADAPSSEFPVKLVLIERVPRPASGPEYLSDIRDDASNAAALSAIVGAVETLTDHPELRVHASLAGGRKTMSSSLEDALMLFGRPDDELSHVLVPEAAESERAFFFPPPGSKMAIDLGLRPYLRLRPLVTEDPLVWRRSAEVRNAEGPQYDFNRIFRIGSLMVSRPALILTDRTRMVSLTTERPGDATTSRMGTLQETVVLSHQRYAFFRLLAERRLAADDQNDAVVTADDFCDDTTAVRRRLVEIYEGLDTGEARRENLRADLEDPDPKERRAFFNRLRSNLRDELREEWRSALMLSAFGPQKGRAEVWLPDRFSAIRFE